MQGVKSITTMIAELPPKLPPHRGLPYLQLTIALAEVALLKAALEKLYWATEHYERDTIVANARMITHRVLKAVEK